MVGNISGARLLICNEKKLCLLLHCLRLHCLYLRYL